MSFKRKATSLQPLRTALPDSPYQYGVIAMKRPPSQSPRKSTPRPSAPHPCPWPFPTSPLPHGGDPPLSDRPSSGPRARIKDLTELGEPKW